MNPGKVLDKLPIVAVILPALFVLLLVLLFIYATLFMWVGKNPVLIFIYLGLWLTIPGLVATIAILTNPTNRLMSALVAIISFSWFLFTIYLIPSLCNISPNYIPTLICYRLFFSFSYF